MSLTAYPKSGINNDAIIGQEINLTTKADVPTGDPISNTWTLDNTTVGDYVPTAAGVTIAKTITDQKDISFHWVYPGNKLHVKYHYCVTIPGVGEPCSPDATATFDVQGVESPSISIDNELVPNINYLTGCKMGNGEVIPSGQNLVYGDLGGSVPQPVGFCGVATGIAGIRFFPHGTPPGAGNFFFVQTINSDVINKSGAAGVTACSDTSTSGLDKQYPYQLTVNKDVADAPETLLQTPYTSVSRDFRATMYLFWQSTITGAIPVPLGYIKWTFQATATWSNGQWSASGAGAPYNGPNGNIFVPSSSSQPNFGLPTWGGPTSFTTTCNQ